MNVWIVLAVRRVLIYGWKIKIPQGCDTFIWLAIVAVLGVLNQLSGLIKNTSDIYFKVKEEVQKSRTHQDINSE